MNLLLDTHIVIWWLSDPEKLAAPQATALANTATSHVSDISLWEIALLTELKRIRLSLPLREWLELAVSPPRVVRCGITPAIAAQVAELPAEFHRDPGDRIIVSTALVMGLTLVTSDRRIIESGLVPVIC